MMRRSEVVGILEAAAPPKGHLASVRFIFANIVYTTHITRGCASNECCFETTRRAPGVRAKRPSNPSAPARDSTPLMNCGYRRQSREPNSIHVFAAMLTFTVPGWGSILSAIPPPGRRRRHDASYSCTSVDVHIACSVPKVSTIEEVLQEPLRDWTDLRDGVDVATIVERKLGTYNIVKCHLLRRSERCVRFEKRG